MDYSFFYCDAISHPVPTILYKNVGLCQEGHSAAKKTAKTNHDQIEYISLM